MTLQELYASVDGDYAQAKATMEMDQLIAHCIRIFRESDPGAALAAAGEDPDAQRIFEAAHSMKGVCGNLGFTRLAGLAGEITEEFRPGNPRRFSDAEIKEKINETDRLYLDTIAKIDQYLAEV